MTLPQEVVAQGEMAAQWWYGGEMPVGRLNMTPLAAASPLAGHRSRKLIPEFRLHRPRSATEAVALKAAAGPGAVFMAGGIDVVNRMKFGVPVTEVIHLGRLDGLDRIEEWEGELHLGALVTHDRLATSPHIGARLPSLAQTWPDVANIRIRCKGTIGGNIMAGDPSYDFALAAVAADAQLHFLSLDGGTTVLAAAGGATQHVGLLTAIVFPFVSTLRLLFDRSLRPIVTLALGLDLAGGRITGGRAAIGCAYPALVAAKLPFDEPLLPAELVRRAAPLAQAVAAELPEPLGDHYGSSGYRRRMIELLLRRNLGAVA
jgi:carbon-monoxide dehydrogenase medium subunit